MDDKEGTPTKDRVKILGRHCENGEREEVKKGGFIILLAWLAVIILPSSTITPPLELRQQINIHTTGLTDLILAIAERKRACSYRPPIRMHANRSHSRLMLLFVDFIEHQEKKKCYGRKGNEGTKDPRKRLAARLKVLRLDASPSNSVG